MIDLKIFKFKLQLFPSNYMKDFDEFWKWKLKTETENKHILDINHRQETCSEDYYKLPKILHRWQAYRNSKNPNPLRTLQDSLRNISNAYDQIRKYSLLEFSEIPNEPLELIWHELGRVKEYGGNRNDSGFYHVISVCKPLMLLWGQTPAFDSRVRKNLPTAFWGSEEWEENRKRVGGMTELVIPISPGDTNWNFEHWKKMMEKFQKYLKRKLEIVNAFKKESLERYGTDSVVPYGRFLDICYF